MCRFGDVHVSKVSVRTHATLHLIEGGDLQIVAAWTARLLSSVAPFHFKSLLMVAISVQLLRRVVLLSPPLRNPSEEGEVSIHARGHFFSILCSPSSFVIYISSPSVTNSSMHDQELQPVSKNSVAIKNNGATQNGSLDRDRADLIRLGKKPVLRVGLVIAVNLLWETDMLYSLAELRVHVDAGFQLHPTRHLGIFLEVCIADL